MEPQNKNADEIDLLYFFNPLLKGLKRIGVVFKNYMGRLQRNFILFSVIFLLISGFGYALRYILPKSFKTNAVFVSYNLPAGFCSEMVNNLKYLTNKENSNALATQLKITPAAAASIQSIYAVPMDSLITIGKKDTVAASVFKINLVLTSEIAIPQIQEGLEAFLENNEFSLRRKEAKRTMLEALRNDLAQRIVNLDSLKDLLSKSVIPRSNGQGIILGEPVSPIEAYQVQQGYYKTLKEIEEKLSLLRNVEVVQPFLRLNAPNSPNFDKMFLIAILMGLGVSLIVTPILGRK